MSEREMMLAKGGSPLSITKPDIDQQAIDQAGFWEGVQPCPPPYRPCNGPNGTLVNGGICCLVPCFGWLHDFGYAVLQGMSSCSAV